MECDNQSTTPAKDSTSCHEANGRQKDEPMSQHQEYDKLKNVKRTSQHTESSGEVETESDLSAETQKEQNVNNVIPEGNDGLHVSSQEEQNVNSANPEESDGLQAAPQEEQNTNSDFQKEKRYCKILLQERQNVNSANSEGKDGPRVILQPKESVNTGDPGEGDQLHTLFKEEETSPGHHKRRTEHRRRMKSISTPGYISGNHSYPNEDTPEHDRIVAEFILHLVHTVRCVNEEVNIVMVGPVMLTSPKNLPRSEKGRCVEDQMRKFTIQSVINSIAHSGTVQKRQQFLQNKPTLYNQGRITLEGRLYILMKMQSFIHEAITGQEDSLNPYTYFAGIRAMFEGQRPGTPIKTVETRNKKAPPHFVPRTKGKFEVLYFTDYFLPNREEHMGFDRALNVKHIVMKKLMYPMLTQQVRQHNDTLKFIMFEVNAVLID